eukprot:13826058-Alexandrium_andersonii.AAC.1
MRLPAILHGTGPPVAHPDPSGGSSPLDSELRCELRSMSTSLWWRADWASLARMRHPYATLRVAHRRQTRR